MPFDLKTGLTSPSGARLTVHQTQTRRKPVGVVQICHGMVEHAARYGRFAAFLSARGFHCVAHDHRGHGGTTAPDAPRGVFGKHDGADKVIADVIAVRDRIDIDFAGLPVILFGHSMGGLIALNVLTGHAGRYAGAAIWNANFSAGLAGKLATLLLRWERLRRGSDMPSRLLPKLTFRAWGRQVTDARTEFDWLSRDPDEVDKYVADPLCGFDASVSLWQDVFDLTFRGADDAALDPIPRDLPINLAGGEKDPATFGGKAVTALAQRLEAKGFQRVTAMIYPGTRHETLNEINRDAAMADFVRWANAALASQSPRTGAK
ncbi:MAG: alpha/beta hydrolase [Rhizobiaceae bacterium]|nr:alpha/beta hydrolase [Rhizobiaceae bacterium]MCV0409166.1 alpha/beta hydrolase [Rhizobiaceae bacterium]